MAGQLLNHFTPSILHFFSPQTRRLPVLKPQPLYPQLRCLILQTIKACTTLDSLYIWIILVRNAPSQQITPSPLHRFTPSEQITPSLLHHFTPLGSPILTSFYPLWTSYPPLLHHFIPLGSPTFASIYPLWTNYPLTLTPYYPPWQPNSYIILTPLNNLPPHSYNILTPLAAQLLHHFTPSEKITPSLLHHFTPLGSPTLASFYPLWTNYPLTLTPF